VTAARSRWQWRFEAADGATVERPGSPVFLARFEAEEWLGEHWRALAGQGVRRAVLRNDDIDLRPGIELPAG